MWKFIVYVVHDFCKFTPNLMLAEGFYTSPTCSCVYGLEPIDFQWPRFLKGCLVAILDFSVSEWHGFSSITQGCFGISVSNFMCMSFVAVGRSLTIVSYVTFKMAALWFCTMFNCNPPIAYCHPLLWDGGILVDHWSTISSLLWYLFLWIHFMINKYWLG